MRDYLRLFIALLLIWGYINESSGHVVYGKTKNIVDHSLFEQLLMQYVKDGLVDYAGVKLDSRLNTYLEQVSATDPETLGSEQEKLAFWINVYNAYTLKLIVDHYPVESIEDIGKDAGGPWSIKMAQVNGVVYTLDEIENEIIRKQFNEPRIHFALVCAALGCPPLRSEAYTGEKLDKQLTDATKTFLQDKEKTRIDRENNMLWVSPIIKWFSGDFEKKHGTVINFLEKYFTEEDKPFLRNGNFTLMYFEYDWRLNKQ